MTVDVLRQPAPPSSLNENQPDKRAPMAAAPLVYNEDNSVAWERMWDSFCVLAAAGGPPHRATLLAAQTAGNSALPSYQFAVDEIVRGIALVSGLTAAPAATGWVAIECGKPSKARWLSEQIRQENVDSTWEATRCFVPVGDYFTIKGEIKNVVTAVAKTTHYWADHLAEPVKASLAWEEKLTALLERIQGWLRR